MSSPYRVLLADDHRLFREGIANLLARCSDCVVVGEAGDWLELLDLLRTLPEPDLVILDLSMPHLQGVETTRELKRRYPGVKVLILSMHKSREYLLRAMADGADGYLLKEDVHDDLLAAVRSLCSGQRFFSPLLQEQMAELAMGALHGEAPVAEEPLSLREIEILRLVAEGKSSKEIADILCIGRVTVQNHRAKIKKRLGISKNTDLVHYALRKGYLTLLP